MCKIHFKSVQFHAKITFFSLNHTVTCRHLVPPCKCISSCCTILKYCHTLTLLLTTCIHTGTCMCQNVLKLAKLMYMCHLKLKYNGFHVKTFLLSVLKTAKGGMNGPISDKSQCIHSVVPQLETTSTCQRG